MGKVEIDWGGYFMDLGIGVVFRYLLIVVLFEMEDVKLGELFRGFVYLMGCVEVVFFFVFRISDMELWVVDG